MPRYPDGHWQAVADIYRVAGDRPALAVAEHFSVPVATARRWFRDMRIRGTLPATSHGRTSEQHARITRIANELGVERYVLARAVLKHIPNGNLRIHPRDTDPA